MSWVFSDPEGNEATAETVAETVREHDGNSITFEKLLADSKVSGRCVVSAAGLEKPVESPKFFFQVTDSDERESRKLSS